MVSEPFFSFVESLFIFTSDIIPGTYITTFVSTLSLNVLHWWLMRIFSSVFYVLLGGWYLSLHDVVNRSHRNEAVITQALNECCVSCNMFSFSTYIPEEASNCTQLRNIFFVIIIIVCSLNLVAGSFHKFPHLNWVSLNHSYINKHNFQTSFRISFALLERLFTDIFSL